MGSITRPGKSNIVSPTARHRRDVSSELCDPDAESRKRTLCLVTQRNTASSSDVEDLFYRLALSKLDLCWSSSSESGSGS